MAEDSKRNQQKHDPKDQRKPRRGPKSQNKPPAEKNSAEKGETSSAKGKPTVEEPGPEFYQNLKRETDEILKITEEANSKYKKKEIQSNWAKYELPIESYEELEEQDMGADYEKLIEASLSSGGHFQFKHEKSWDSAVAPTEFDKYFEINMDTLACALNSIQFYERNDIDVSIFNEIDMTSMNNRAIKFKRKYYNDNTFTTPDLESEEKLLNSFKETIKSTVNTASVNQVDTEEKINEHINKIHDKEPMTDDLTLNLFKKDSSTIHIDKDHSQTIVENSLDLDDILLETFEEPKPSVTEKEIEGLKLEEIVQTTEMRLVSPNLENKVTDIESPPVQAPTKPNIESPEDLEKWLDDFLDS